MNDFDTPISLDDLTDMRLTMSAADFEGDF